MAPDVVAATVRLRAVLVDERYECLGCQVCWPADALNALADDGMVNTVAACPTDTVAARAGWPPLPERVHRRALVGTGSGMHPR